MACIFCDGREVRVKSEHQDVFVSIEDSVLMINDDVSFVDGVLVHGEGNSQIEIPIDYCPWCKRKLGDA